MEKEKKKKTKSHPSRIGSNFFKGVEKIKDARLRKGLDKERISSEKITNLIIKHKLWDKVEEDIINATPEEVEEHGSE